MQGNWGTVNPPPKLQRASSAGDMVTGAYKRAFARFREGYHSTGEIEYDSNDDGGAFTNKDKQSEQALMTARQRQRLAARGTHGGFSSQRKKRRLHCACVSSDIDVQDLFDYLTGSGGSYQGWTYKIYDRVLWMFKAGTAEDSTSLVNIADSHYRRQQQAEGSAADHVPSSSSVNRSHDQDIYNVGLVMSQSAHNIFQPGSQEVFVFEFGATVMWGFGKMEGANMLKTIRMFATKGLVGDLEFEDGEDDLGFVEAAAMQKQTSPDPQAPPPAAARETDYFNSSLLSTNTVSILSDTDNEPEPLSPVQPQAGEGDRFPDVSLDAGKSDGEGADGRRGEDSFGRSHAQERDEATTVAILHDLLVLPEGSTPKLRLSVSYALAQSSVLCVFESRVQKKIIAYKYIPEVRVYHKALNSMIFHIFLCVCLYCRL